MAWAVVVVLALILNAAGSCQGQLLDSEGHPFQPMIDSDGHPIQPLIHEDGHAYYPDNFDVAKPPPPAAAPPNLDDIDGPPQPPLSGQDLLDAKNPLLQEYLGVNRHKRMVDSNDNRPRALNLNKLNVWNREDVFAPIENLDTWHVGDAPNRANFALPVITGVPGPLGFAAILMGVTLVMGCCAKLWYKMLVGSTHTKGRTVTTSSRNNASLSSHDDSSITNGQTTLDKLRVRVLGDNMAYSKKNDLYCP